MGNHISNENTFDVAVIGGGINGAGIARDLAGRKLRVLLAEKDDLAAHTSSASTKLIHGGLRYLEQYEFGLVRKSLIEREVLLRSAPHIMRPLRFVMPHHPAMRPMWMLRAGVFLYDHLAKREVLPDSRAIDLRGSEIGAPLKKTYTRGLEYSDGWVDDARLTILNALDAYERGAQVRTRTRCTRARAERGGWVITLQRNDHDETDTVFAKVLVNATGPWTQSFIGEVAGQRSSKALRLVRGSHIVVPKMFDHDRAYIFQNPDNRIIFAIPYEQAFTLVGTTDVEQESLPERAHITEEEIAYLIEMVNRYFEKSIVRKDVAWTYSGVRPLVDDAEGDASKVTRDYDLEWVDEPAPMMNVWGGKLTTYRKLAEEAADRIGGALACSQQAWTATATLPGGDIAQLLGRSRAQPVEDFAAFQKYFSTKHPEIAPQVAARWTRAYGTRALQIAAVPLGKEIAPTLYEGELAYLRDHEWARTAHDVLVRRSKLLLHTTEAERNAVAEAMGG